MNRPQVQSKVRTILCDQLSLTPDQLTDTTHLENDLKADSLDVTEIGMSLEDEFQITIEDSDLARLKTIGDAVNHICEAKGIPLAVTPALKLAKPTYAALQPSPAAPPLPARDCKSCGAHSATGAICSFCGRAL
ncbi:MAG: acyl carrier protein [Verrucomicrobiota bacterium]